MRNLLVWIVTAILFTGLGGVTVWRVLEHREETEAGEHAPETATQPAESEPAITRNEAGNVVITFSEESQDRVGLQVQPLAAAKHQRHLRAFGTFEEDPQQSFTLRSPIAGTLIPTPGGEWPGLGQALATGSAVGRIEPRLSPVELADMTTRLATAQGEVYEIQASLAALRSTCENKRTLNANGKIVSDQVLQEAEAQVKGEEARLSAAETTVHTLEASMAATTDPEQAMVLEIPSVGQVVELLARPGESVDTGQALLRVSHFDFLLARIALPPGQTIEPPPTATITLGGDEPQMLTGHYAGTASRVDAAIGGQTLLYKISSSSNWLQPGMPLVAYLPLAGQADEGVIVPRSAVIRFAGKAWVYVQGDTEAFTRRPVATDTPVPEGWFDAGGFHPEESVVVVGAQSLLSDELMLSAAGGEEEE